MFSLYSATQNKNKIIEIETVLRGRVMVKSIYDLQVTTELPETGSTLRDNALQKARYIHQRFGVNCFADDTGLEVQSLNGEPGVYSARYAGPDKDPRANMDLLMKKLVGKPTRKARFVTVIALIISEKEYVFEGAVEGEIIDEKRGTGGFGYDPIFKPLGYDRTFAEMSLEEKSKISHRAIAVKKMADFLNDLKF